MTWKRPWLLAIGILTLTSLAPPAVAARDVSKATASRAGSAKASRARAPSVLKCWTTEEGVRECGNAVPPEYAQDGYREIAPSGAVRERPGAPSPEELAAARQRAEAERVEREQLAERVAQDRVLLSTFTKVEDIQLTRDGKVAVIESRIKLVENRLADLERGLRRLREHAAQEERAGKGVSPELRADLDRGERQVAEQRQFIIDQRQEQEQVRARFSADLERFQALKSGKAKPGDP